MTASRPLPVPAPARSITHEHGWFTESRHRTSQGAVVYVRCAECGTRRVDVVSPPVSDAQPPTPLSRTVPLPVALRATDSARHVHHS